jgi:O-methyltransferase involved in polyketide biosynthesis
MAGEKVSLSGAQQTLLITLHCKAVESRMPDSVLRDRFADAAEQRLDADFSKLDLGRDGAISLALRAKIFDDWVRDFMGSHRDAVVLNLGCGLDSRVFRVDPPDTVVWFDVDLPDVVELRQRVYPARAGNYRLIAASVTDPDWLRDLPADRPAMVVAEGLMPYLPQDEAPKLVAQLVSHFRSGKLAFDGYSRLGLKMLRITPQLRATGAQVHYSIEDPRELEAAAPGLRFVGEDVQYDTPQIARMSLPGRLTVRLFRSIPALRRIGRLLRYEWRTAGNAATERDVASHRHN